MLFHGRCHCGNISFELDWQANPEKIPARVCDCEFCSRHGNIWAADPSASLQVSITDPLLVNQYSFGTRTAQFSVCRVCGVTPLAISMIEDHRYAVINVNTLIDVAPELLDIVAVSFEGEDVAGRLARRKRGWIADVRLTPI